MLWELHTYRLPIFAKFPKMATLNKGMNGFDMRDLYFFGDSIAYGEWDEQGSQVVWD